MAIYTLLIYYNLYVHPDLLYYFLFVFTLFNKDKLNYYFSAGYPKDGGIIENSGFDRLTTRLNVDYQVKKWLKVGANIAYTNSESRYPGDQTSLTSSMNSFYMANEIAPVYPIFIRDAGHNWHSDIANAWTPENRYTNVPRIDAMDEYTNASSDR